MANMPINSYDVYLFHEGNHFRSYEFLGAHLVNYNGLDGTSFCTWAPNAKEVRVVGEFNDWNSNDYCMSRVEDSGLWYIFIPGIKQWDMYKYEIHTKDGRILVKSDPYAFYSELRPGTASKVVNLKNYQWNDSKWLDERSLMNVYERPVNIYEVHLGSWKRKWDGEFHTYRELADDLIDYVCYMGYTHIEILPLTEHPFDGSWGYQSTGYFSVTSRYGSPYDFMYFVDRCHQKGIGVIMDWVPGHFCKDDHGLRRFDGTPLYEYADEVKGENIGWGTANFDLGRNEVMSFLVSNALFWFDMYHIDGIRVDAVASMLYLDFGKNHGEWQPNKYGGRENIEAVEFIKRLNKAVYKFYPNVLMVAEESTTWPLVTAPTYLGGLGFNYKWNMGWMNDMLKYMEMDSVYRKFHHNLITFSFMYIYSENFILPLSHDEVVHGKKSLIDKMPGDYWQKFANLRAFYGYMITHPGKKLLFMGGEFGQFIEWRYAYGLDWILLEYDMHKKLQLYVKQLNELYKSEKMLWELDHTWDGFEWIDPNNYNQSVIAFMRKSKNPSDFMIVVCNFTPVYHDSYRIGVPYMGEYKEIFNSDSEEYGGSGQINYGSIYALDEKWHNQEHTIVVKIPPLAAIMIKGINIVEKSKKAAMQADVELAEALELTLI
ncbi:MAG: 1,4-alpha-glucan branching protein GlgB [Bacillota bacterium]